MTSAGARDSAAKRTTLSFALFPFAAKFRLLPCCSFFDEIIENE